MPHLKPKAKMEPFTNSPNKQFQAISKGPLTILTTVENSAIGNSCTKKNIIPKIEAKTNRTDKTDTCIKDKYFDLFNWLCSEQVLEENYFDKRESSAKSNHGVYKGQTYWGNVMSVKTVPITVIKKEYKIRFTYTPRKAYFKNNRILINL